MAALAKLLPLLQQHSNTASEASGLSPSVLAAVQAMLKQAVERIGRIREVGPLKCMVCMRYCRHVSLYRDPFATQCIALKVYLLLGLKRF